MKILFSSPLNPLWADELAEMAFILKSEIINLGDILREEMQSDSKLGQKVQAALKEGKSIKASLIAKILAKNFFYVSKSQILTGFPINTSQSRAIAKELKGKQKPKVCSVFINTDKESVLNKQTSTFYDFSNEKLIETIDLYFSEDGILSALKELNTAIDCKLVTFVSPLETANYIDSL